MPRMFDILRGNIPEDDKPEEEKNPDPGSEAEGEAEPDPEAGDIETTPSEDNESLEEPQIPPQPVSFPREIADHDFKEKTQEDYSLISKKLISAIWKRGVDNQEKANEIYEDAVGAVKALLEKVRNNDDITKYMERLYELLDNVFNQLVMGDNILNGIYEKKNGEYFLPYHVVNVLILSSIVGLNMGFNKSRLSHLGLASIFYDIGMDSMKELIEEPRELTAEERKTVRTHIDKSMEIIERIGTVNDVVKETVLMHHERVSGNGYPAGMRTGDINPYAKIIGLVDTYEAITHPRPHREGMNTHKAVRFILGALKNDFEADVMKIFINKMSVYPIGSIVTLDTEEVARVISVQVGSPLRPVVMVLKDANGMNVKEKVVLDLSKQDFPSIKD